MNSLTPDERDLLERICEKEELRPFFFRKARGLKWFDPLAERGYFNPTENPRPQPSKEEGYVTVPIWFATEYLVSTSPDLLREKNNDYSEKFVNLLRVTTRYAIEHKFSNYRTWWQFSKIVQNIPSTLIRDDDMALFDYWLSDPYETSLIVEEIGGKWLITLLESQIDQSKKLAQKLLAIIYRLEFRTTERGVGTRKEAMLRFRPWNARKVTEKVASIAGRVLGGAAVRIFQKQLESILVELECDKWSSVWRPAVCNHEQNHNVEHVEDVVLEGYRDSLLEWTKEGTSESRQYIQELLNSPYETIRRIAVYAIDQRYIYLRNCVDLVITEQYFTSNFRHEMWHLLKNNYKEFSDEQRRHILGVIDSLTETSENDHMDRGATAYRKAIWLSAIKDSDDYLAQRYRECVAVAGGEPETPDFSTYMTSGRVNHSSPFSKEELLSLDVDELAKKLAKYCETYTPRHDRKEPDLEGLAKMLRELVKGDPLRYYNQLHKFAQTDLPFVYELIEAYSELWSENTQLPWDEIWGALLEFCLCIVNQDRFWSSETSGQGGSFVANRHWIVQGIGRLIEAGTKSDEHAFSESFLGKAEEILLILLEKEEGAEFKIDDDAVMVAINSPRGRCVEALINLTLRACRLANKRSGNHEETWAHFQQTYDLELARAEIGGYEFATLVANFLPNFIYMSHEWVLANLTSIFDKNIYQKWLCAMRGYSYVGTVYEEIYNHLKENGHLILALDDEILSEKMSERIIQNIAIAYINNFEALEDDGSLIHQILTRSRPNELSELIWFFWSQRKDGDKNIHTKVFVLWPHLLKTIDTNTREGRGLASKLCDWSVFVDEVNDENKQLLLAVASFAEEDYNSHGLLESIARLSDKQPFESFEIWHKLLEHAKPDFPEEAIRATLTNLVRVGPDGLRKARDIVSLYLKGGNERPSQWLQEIVATVHNV